ncbi:hypothetical protein PanWU01x14_334480 [Parasponia andersonii]|uniref:Uncharacterized protein n=1 Tax=Parasponia andersonii TaxID=3476 RepID=A0A2P5AGJ3_PARAD|nr:hypothetical protein PanWU01x14_334480 [Parasponia andersonii]
MLQQQQQQHFFYEIYSFSSAPSNYNACNYVSAYRRIRSVTETAIEPPRQKLHHGPTKLQKHSTSRLATSCG